MKLFSKIKKGFKIIIYNTFLECVENELKIDVVYIFNNSKICTSVVSVPRIKDYVKLFYSGTYQELQVNKVVFEMHGGVVHIYLEKP